MPRLTPCPSCHSHVLLGERECPHCEASLRPVVAGVPAALISLALAGCPGPAEPVYGVPDDGSPDETETGMETGTDTGTTSVGEPEYGVPDTGP